jgi:protocatechuate 3,4-dioxygenase beta subunit
MDRPGSGPYFTGVARVAMNLAAGPANSRSAAALAQEVLRTMLTRNLRSVALTLLLGAVVTDAARPDEVDPKPSPGRMFVVGRVLDPSGKPVPGATVAAYARSLATGHAPRLSPRTQVPIGDARADASGRFRIDAPRISSLHHHAFGAVALAPGHGAGWVELDPDEDQPAADITLRPEQVIQGRLFDVQGRPVPDVTLSVATIRRVLPQAAAGDRVRSEGISYDFININDFPAWPRPVRTDAEGRFTLRGVGQDLNAILIAHHPRFALQRIPVETDHTSQSKSITAALLPAQIITGRVTYADTEEGVPHAPLVLLASNGRAAIPAAFETDAEGRFRLNPPPADRSYGLTAYPPQGQPYLPASKGIEWPKGALEQSVDIALPRGISIRGKVTEAGSGKPVPGAAVAYFGRGRRQGGRPSASNSLDTASDGSFHLGAEPVPGSLFIKGPTDDYVLQAIGIRMMNEGQPGGTRIYAHAHALLDLKPGTESQEVNLVLRRGATVTGRVLGPDGQPVREAWFFSPIILDPNRVTWASWSGRAHGTVRDGQFEIHGLDPDTEVPVYFLDPKGKLGAVVKLSGKSAAGGPVTVRLEHCGAARARLVGPGGKPIAGRLPRGYLVFSMVITPGPPRTTAADSVGLITADEDDLAGIDPVNYATAPAPDADGRITLPALIPGAVYRFVDYTTPRGTNPSVRKEFTVKPGETLELGELRIEKPPAP